MPIAKSENYVKNLEQELRIKGLANVSKIDQPNGKLSVIEKSGNSNKG